MSNFNITGSLNFQSLAGGGKQVLLDFIYPVGTYVVIENSNFDTKEKMAAHYGGTWEKIEGRFILGASSTYSVGSTGGEATHTLTENEMPSHTHTMSAGSTNSTNHEHSTANGANVIAMCPTKANLGHNPLSNAKGGNQPHNNMPPYRVAYIYKRIA